MALRGPVVAALADAFAAVWPGQHCPGALGPAPAPAASAPGERVVQLQTRDPEDAEIRIGRALPAAIDASWRSVDLTVGDFAPGAEVVLALCDAASRNVAWCWCCRAAATGG